MIDAAQSVISAFGGPAPVESARPSPAAALPETKGASFSDVLAEVAGDAVGTLHEAEATSISALQGETSVLEVVEAVQSAEQTLQTAIAIRDKVVSAYQEISRMAI